MGLFSAFASRGMDSYVDQAKKEGATLVDVRGTGEFTQGHVEGAVNIPLQNIATADKTLTDKNAAYYVYCLSGARSSKACAMLKKMGYANVTNIGGIGMYHGPVVTGAK